MPITAIAFTAYPVTDLARAVAFYRDVLGLPGGELATDFWHEFELGGATFGIGAFPQLGTPGTAQSLALETDDLPALRKRLADLGHETPEPHETPVCFISSVKDPDGNHVILHEQKKP